MVVMELFKAGDHIPEIPLLDVVGNATNGSPLQIVATGVNVGVQSTFKVSPQFFATVAPPCDGR